MIKREEEKSDSCRHTASVRFSCY